MEKRGILLRMNGLPSSPGEIAAAHIVAEHGSYMRDYISDTEGGVSEVDFRYVTEETSRAGDR